MQIKPFIIKDDTWFCEIIHDCIFWESVIFCLRENLTSGEHQMGIEKYGKSNKKRGSVKYEDALILVYGVVYKHLE